MSGTFTDPPRCTFCAIVRGRLPSSRVYEDDEILSFLTRRPTRPGELLVIPKEHVDHFTDVPGSIAARMMVCAHRLGRILRQELRPLRVGFVVSGFGVPHAHLIVLPLHEEQDITSARFVRVVDGEVRYDAAKRGGVVEGGAERDGRETTPHGDLVGREAVYAFPRKHRAGWPATRAASS